MIELILATLLSMFPHMPVAPYSCIQRTESAIESALSEAQLETGVPPAILLVTAFLETHVGCDHGEGGGWGAPRSSAQRHTAGTSIHAARSLELGFERCRTWQGAVSHFRCGNCRCRDLGWRINRHGHRERVGGYRAEDALILVQRIHERIGLPLPENFRHRENH